jgi:hypothetical protein
MRAPAAGPEKPALQEQFVKGELPAGEEEFEGQTVHVAVRTLE